MVVEHVVRYAISVPAPRIWLTVYDALFPLRKKALKRKKKHLTSLQKWLKGRKQKFDYLPFDVCVNPVCKHGSESLCFARLFSVFGIADMCVTSLLRELHECVVYQLGRRRLLIMLMFKKLR